LINVQTYNPHFCIIRSIISRVLLSVIILFVFTNFRIYAQGASLPMNIQAALLTKVLKFNPKFIDKPQIKVLIIYNRSTRLNKEELASELVAKNIDVKAILPDELGNNIKNCDIVYFMPGISDQDGICKANKVMTISGAAKFVEEGQMSIAFGVQNDKPKIYINVTSLKLEDQNISSELLRIAKVYK
jgi:hypothetical protein